MDSWSVTGIRSAYDLRVHGVREFNVQHFAKILLLKEFLNETGKDGWELVSVATTPTANFIHLVYLKRPAALTERVDLVPPP